MVSRRWRASPRGGRCDVDLVLMANNLAIANARKASSEVGDQTSVDSGRKTASTSRLHLLNACVVTEPVVSSCSMQRACDEPPALLLTALSRSRKRRLVCLSSSGRSMRAAA